MKTFQVPSAAWLLALLLGLVTTAHAGSPVTPKSPNILFIIADDLAARLGCYGDKSAITPHLDRLAADGVVFERAYCQGAVCTASRTSFMLGLNSRHAKASHFLNHPETMTMGRWFRERGYQTCAIGKIDHDDPTDSYVDPKAWDVRVKREDMAPKTPIQRRFFDEDLGLMRKRVSNIGIAETPEAIGDWVRTERMLEFFEKERDATKPFFAALGFHAPHVPWDSTRAVYEAHNPAGFTVKKTPPGATGLPAGSMLQEPGMELTEPHQREGQRAYYAAVTMLDQQVGRLLEHLRSRDLLENTIVVFTSDHGYHLGWRGQWCKHSIDEEVMRVPLIVSHPQGARGAKAEGIVELLDLFPSLCEATGQPLPNGLDGKSFVPLLKDPKAEGKPGAFCQWGNGRTVRTQRWRLTERNDGTNELYDHNNDPGESFNVIAQPEHASLVPSLHAMLEAEFGPRPPRKPAGPNAERKGKTQANNKAEK
jgi:arylsulfatase A-like enzyme